MGLPFKKSCLFGGVESESAQALGMQTSSVCALAKFHKLAAQQGAASRCADARTPTPPFFKKKEARDVPVRPERRTERNSQRHG